jgi:uncharacterized protein YjbJ (UPF0337 family)
METTKSKANEKFEMTGNWETQAKELKKNYAQLTDADLKFEAGKENELLGRIETRLKKNREEVIGIIKKGQPAKGENAPHKAPHTA